MITATLFENTKPSIEFSNKRPNTKDTKIWEQKSKYKGYMYNSLNLHRSNEGYTIIQNSIPKNYVIINIPFVALMDVLNDTGVFGNTLWLVHETLMRALGNSIEAMQYAQTIDPCVTPINKDFNFDTGKPH